MKEVDTETLDMRAIQILVGHKQYFAISQTVFYIIRSIFAPDFKPEDLLDFRNFVVFRDFFEGFPACIHHFAFHRTPGFGDTDWTRLISELRRFGYRGSIDIEGWHDPVYRDQWEMTGQVHGLRYLQQCRGGAFVLTPPIP